MRHRAAIGLAVGTALAVAAACGPETRDAPLSTLSGGGAGGAPPIVDAGGEAGPVVCATPVSSIGFTPDASTCPPAGTYMGSGYMGETCVQDFFSKGGVPDDAGMCWSDQCERPDAGCM